jgi:uncharacterized protein YqjF (DUF2071 family)
VWSHTRVQRDGDLYVVVAGRHLRIVLRVGAPLPAGPLERFVTNRWGLHTQVAGRTVHLPVAHPPWPLRTAELVDLAGDPLAAAGMPAAPGPPVSVLFSPGVDDVRLGLPRRV